MVDTPTVLLLTPRRAIRGLYSRLHENGIIHIDVAWRHILRGDKGLKLISFDRAVVRHLESDEEWQIQCRVEMSRLDELLGEGTWSPLPPQEDDIGLSDADLLFPDLPFIPNGYITPRSSIPKLRMADSPKRRGIIGNRSPYAKEYAKEGHPKLMYAGRFTSPQSAVSPRKVSPRKVALPPSPVAMGELFPPPVSPRVLFPPPSPASRASKTLRRASGMPSLRFHDGERSLFRRASMLFNFTHKDTSTESSPLLRSPASPSRQ
jgi:hypothetical protein